MTSRRPQTQIASTLSLNSAERRNRILLMKRSGSSYREIAEAIGVSPQACWVHVRESLVSLAEENRELAESIRQRDFATTEVLLDFYAPLAMSGDKDACALVLKIQARRARLMGLDAAIKIDKTITPERAASSLEELTSQIRQRLDFLKTSNAAKTINSTAMLSGNSQ